MPSAHPLNLEFRDVRGAGVRGELGGRSGSPSLRFGLPVEPSVVFVYNHVNRSFLVGVGLLGRGVWVARPFLCLHISHAFKRFAPAFLDAHDRWVFSDRRRLLE